MKTLSLLQPWASLVSLGLKKYETRSWTTRYRGPLLIHSSAGKNRLGRALWNRLASRSEFPQLVGGVPPSFDDLPFGRILCQTTLIDTLPAAAAAKELGDLEILLGDFSVGRFAWGLGEISRIEPPLPARGALQLWDFDLQS